MTTSNQPDAVAERVSALPRLPRDAGGPVFAEPWQAQAFALAVKLSEDGHFTWKEWADALANELKAADDRGEPDDGTHYYEHWLAAMERLVVDKGLTNREAMRERKAAWTEAYLIPRMASLWNGVVASAKETRAEPGPIGIVVKRRRNPPS
jgi:nitrile hydratase accessory protein